MVEKQRKDYSIAKVTKLKHMVRAGKRFAAISVLACGLMLAPKAADAHKQDSASTKKKPAIEFVAKPKAVVRSYEKGGEPAGGIGTNFSLGGKLGVDGSLSAVQGKDGLELEEGSLSRFISIKRMGGGVIPIIYFDKFYRVDAKNPSGMVILKSGPVKIGLDHGFDKTLQFVKYTDPKTGFGIKGILLECGDKVGYFAPIGKPQVAGCAISIPAKFLGMKIDTELQMMVKIRPPGAGETKMLHIRIVITP
jgi:hypothetical protein